MQCLRSGLHQTHLLSPNGTGLHPLRSDTVVSGRDARHVPGQVSIAQGVLLEPDGDSKNPAGGMLLLTPGQWRELAKSV